MREKKEKRLAIKVTAKEHAQIVKLSQEAKESISDYVVKKAMSVKNRK